MSETFTVKPIEQSVPRICRNVQVEIKLTGVRRVTTRIWIATQIMKLAGWVMPFGATIEVSSEVPEP